MLNLPVALLCLASAPTATDATPIAVFDFAAVGLGDETDRGLGRSLAAIVAAEVQALGHRTISSADLDAMLSLEKQKDLLGCEENTSCLAEIGGALGVELMVAGTIGRLGGSYTLTLTLIDTRRAEVRQRFQGEAGSTDVLANTARRGVGVLFEKTVDVKGTGILVVRTEPDGGEILLDGKPVGRAPATLDEVPAGEHQLSARLGEQQGTLDVRVRSGQVERVTIRLQAGPGVTVKILSTPPDATVYLDGAVRGTTPLVAADVAAGLHTVRLEAPGYLPLEQSITLSREEYERGGEVPLKVELALREHVTLLPVPVGVSAGAAADGRALGDGVALAIELFVEPLPWLEVGLGYTSPVAATLTLRWLPLHGGLELGLIARGVAFAESPTLRDGSPAVAGGLCAGWFSEVGLGELGVRLEVLLSRQLKPARIDLWTVPVALSAAWRI